MCLSPLVANVDRVGQRWSIILPDFLVSSFSCLMGVMSMRLFEILIVFGCFSLSSTFSTFSTLGGLSSFFAGGGVCSENRYNSNHNMEEILNK